MRRRWECRRCGGHGTTRLEAVVVYHQCRPQQAELDLFRSYDEGITREERRQELYRAAAAALGGAPSIWRPLDGADGDEEAEK